MKLRRKKTARQKQVDRLDDLFSDFIRKRAMLRVHGCERCGAGKTSYQQLDCAHNESRVHHGTRWDEDNALGLCPGCHRYIDHEKKEKERLFIQWIGQETYDELDLRAHSRNKMDFAVVELYLKQKLAEIGE